jgi:hypothetical protein
VAPLLGFVPGTVTTENRGDASPQSSLNSSLYIDENEQEGLILAIPRIGPKAFDPSKRGLLSQSARKKPSTSDLTTNFIMMASHQCSINALALALALSPQKESESKRKAIRRILTIHCGVPQRCPLSPH